jgi:hypothetical protein
VNPYEHLTVEQLSIRAKLMAEEAQALLAEIDRRRGIAEGSRRTRGGLRVIDGGRSAAH